MKFSCPHCGQHLAGDDSLAEATVECPNCGTPFQIPMDVSLDISPSPETSESEPETTSGVLPSTASAEEPSAVDKPSMEQWLAQTGKQTGQASLRLGKQAGEASLRFGGWAWKALLRFLRFEQPTETDIVNFNGDAAKAFEFRRLVPLSVICLGFGWMASWIASATESVIDAPVRWLIFPISALSLYGAIRSIRHFLRPKTAQWVPWIAICLFTAVVGLSVLTLLQLISGYASSHDVKAAGEADTFVAIAKLIGWGYQVIDDPNASIFTKFLGFSCGVGLCEESVKLLPIFLLVFFRKKLPFKLDLSFRSFLMLGFFSGLGFGIGEALSSQYGIMPIPNMPGPMPSQNQFVQWLGGYAIPNISAYNSAMYRWQANVNEYRLAVQNSALGNQITRWFACVPSHAVYTVIDAACLWVLGTRISREASPSGKVLWFMACVAVVAVLHGIYDTLCDTTNLGIVLDALSLVLMWFVVRFAAKAKEVAGEASRTGFEDMDTRTVSTFGKSFAKMYLVILAGIAAYAYLMDL